MLRGEVMAVELDRPARASCEENVAAARRDERHASSMPTRRAAARSRRLRPRARRRAVLGARRPRRAARPALAREAAARAPARAAPRRRRARPAGRHDRLLRLHDERRRERGGRRRAASRSRRSATSGRVPHPRRPEFLLTLPHVHGTSGFFIARLRPSGRRRRIARVAWHDWIRTVEVEPSLYAADFARLGEQIDMLLRPAPRLPLRRRRRALRPAGDDGPVVLRSIAPIDPRDGRRHRLPPDGRQPAAALPEFAARAATASRSTSRGRRRPRDVARRARARARRSASRSTPRREPADAATRRRRRRHGALHEHPARLLGTGVHAGGARAHRASSRALRRRSRSRSTAASATENARRSTTRARRCSSPGSAVFGREDPAARLPAARRAPRVSHSSGRSRSPSAASARRSPNPSVGAVVVARRRGRRRGLDERAGGRHAEVVALDAAGERARGATLYVTLEPCAHHGRTPPCVDAVVAAGVARVVVGALDPNPEAAGGLERLRAAGVEVERSSTLRGAAPERGVAHVGRARRARS